MEKMIGYCGYNCHLCAARSDNPEIRQKLVDGWKKIFGHQMYNTENVRCDGCKANGRLADKSCKARPCAIKKKVKNCALCNKFPCDKVRGLFASREGMLLYCYPRTAHITKQEYDLCMRQFINMPNLLKILVKQGKIPASLFKNDEEQ